MMSRPDLRRLLRVHPLFCEFDDETFDAVLRCARVVTLTAGELVFHRGERASQFFVVLDGAVNLVLHSRAGDEKVVETLRAGRSFGESLVFDASPTFPLAGSARDSSTVVAIPSEAYRSALAGSTAACIRLLAEMNRRVDVLVREVEAHSLTDARTRIARHVLELAGTDSARRAEIMEVVLPETKRRVAARLGVTPETLSRTFRAWCDAGLVAMQGRRIRITDLERLRSAA